MKKMCCITKKMFMFAKKSYKHDVVNKKNKISLPKHDDSESSDVLRRNFFQTWNYSLVRGSLVSSKPHREMLRPFWAVVPQNGLWGGAPSPPSRLWKGRKRHCFSSTNVCRRHPPVRSKTKNFMFFHFTKVQCVSPCLEKKL